MPLVPVLVELTRALFPAFWQFLFAHLALFRLVPARPIVDDGRYAPPHVPLARFSSCVSTELMHRAANLPRFGSNRIRRLVPANHFVRVEATQSLWG